jgi:sugar lactone lactonase YvrE
MAFETLTTGVYLEGLIADADSVWVTDPIKGGLRHLRRDGSLVKTWLPEKLWVGSLLFNGDGVMLMSGEHGIAWLDTKTGETGYLADRVGGEPLLGANEMVTDGKGGIYFGSLDVAAIATGGTPGPASLYRLGPDGVVTELRSGFTFCNGVGVSADGKRLYFNETFTGVSMFDIRPDGTLGEKQFLLEKPDADGMAIDEAGTVWVSGYQSSCILGLAPDGTERARLQTPAGGVTNIWFGGPDRRDLYMTGVSAEAGETIRAGKPLEGEGSFLLHTRVETPGIAIPPAGFDVRTRKRR